jgi:hypothetical protein
MTPSRTVCQPFVPLSNSRFGEALDCAEAGCGDETSMAASSEATEIVKRVMRPTASSLSRDRMPHPRRAASLVPWSQDGPM